MNKPVRSQQIGLALDQLLMNNRDDVVCQSQSYSRKHQCFDCKSKSYKSLKNGIYKNFTGGLLGKCNSNLGISYFINKLDTPIPSNYIIHINKHAVLSYIDNSYNTMLFEIIKSVIIDVIKYKAIIDFFINTMHVRCAEKLYMSYLTAVTNYKYVIKRIVKICNDKNIDFDELIDTLYLRYFEERILLNNPYINLNNITTKIVRIYVNRSGIIPQELKLSQEVLNNIEHRIYYHKKNLKTIYKSFETYCRKNDVYDIIKNHKRLYTNICKNSVVKSSLYIDNTISDNYIVYKKIIEI